MCQAQIAHFQFFPLGMGRGSGGRAFTHSEQGRCSPFFYGRASLSSPGSNIKGGLLTVQVATYFAIKCNRNAANATNSATILQKCNLFCDYLQVSWEVLS